MKKLNVCIVLGLVIDTWMRGGVIKFQVFNKFYSFYEESEHAC